MVARTWKEKESRELAVLRDAMSFGPETQQARGVLAEREAGDSYPDILLSSLPQFSCWYHSLAKSI